MFSMIPVLTSLRSPSRVTTRLSRTMMRYARLRCTKIVQWNNLVFALARRITPSRCRFPSAST